ncbi:helix-turn-helix domain-containing protein [Dickeya fangzhongdai]|uniref:helix-turn-helix domain-containing protein n=1 Tax=Dickeya fangzhongdai TaxID=1778540 RepID=UPI0026E0E87E|nr:helix-turn-helix transcriptional regulator [Dickeya fangzhongdai]WKV49554.1 helix-turn-helix domain-containing protein [Dickeya fangzhongdai]
MRWYAFPDGWRPLFCIVSLLTAPSSLTIDACFLIYVSHMANFLHFIFLVSYMANFFGDILLIGDGITLTAANMASRENMGKTIASTRKARGLTQKQLAEQTGINKTTLSEIENGRFTGSLDIFERYLDAVGLQLELATKQHRLPGWDEVDKLFAEDE